MNKIFVWKQICSRTKNGNLSHTLCHSISFRIHSKFSHVFSLTRIHTYGTCSLRLTLVKKHGRNMENAPSNNGKNKRKTIHMQRRQLQFMHKSKPRKNTKGIYLQLIHRATKRIQYAAHSLLKMKQKIQLIHCLWQNTQLIHC